MLVDCGGRGPRYAIAVDHAGKRLQVDGFGDVVVHSGAETLLAVAVHGVGGHAARN